MGDLFMQKMKTYFTRIDFDKDGSITKKDFEGMGDRFIKHGKFDDAKAKDLRATLGAVSNFMSNLLVAIDQMCFKMP